MTPTQPTRAQDAPTYADALVANEAKIIAEEWANKETMPAKSKRLKWLMLIGVPVAFFVGSFLPFLAAEIKNPTTVVDQIKKGCEREFGYLGEESVRRCTLQLTARKLNEFHQNALDRAYR